MQRPRPDHPMLSVVADLAGAAGGKAWLVGGAVRDWLRTGDLPEDLDFVLVDCKAEHLAKALADQHGGHRVPLDWEFGIHRVVFPASESQSGLTVDLSDALQNDLQTDLARRDLTVNAMAIPLDGGDAATPVTLIDPFNGQGDLITGVMRMVSEQNLLEDPLRLLRIFRFAATLQASSIEAATLAAVQTHQKKIASVAAERIQYELLRLLDATPCFDAVRQMADCGLLETLIPDLTPMRAIPASGFHHLGLFDHSLELVKQAERLYPDCPPEAVDWIQRPFNAVISRFALLKLACLLHDIGKPATMGTRSDEERGERLTFYGHEEVGEEMAAVWLSRMRFGNEARDYVKKLIRWHLYPCQFGPESPRRSVLRFYRRMGTETPDVLLLALADRHSSCGDWLTEEDMAKAHAAHLWLLENYFTEIPVLETPRLLNGHEVMQTLDIGPGPHLKTLLEALTEAQQMGEVKTPEEARQWLLKHHLPPS